MEASGVGHVSVCSALTAVDHTNIYASNPHKPKRWRPMLCNVIDAGRRNDLAQGRTVRKWQSWAGNPRLAPSPAPLATHSLSGLAFYHPLLSAVCLGIHRAPFSWPPTGEPLAVKHSRRWGVGLRRGQSQVPWEEGGERHQEALQSV